MARKSPINIDKYRIGKYPNPKKDPYRLGSTYRPLSDPYKILKKMLRGYKKSAKAQSYSPSSSKGGSSSASSYRSRAQYRPKMRYQPQPPYKPQPTPRTVRSSDRPWTEPPKSKIQPISYKPDIEKMVKQLEKKFDEKLEQEVLERMETGFEELQAALAEKSEASSSAQKEIEAGPEEEAQNQLETTELIDIGNQKTSTEAQAELQIRDSSYDVEEKIEWSKERINDELAETCEQSEASVQPEAIPTLDHSLEPFETNQDIEQPTPEANNLMNEISPMDMDEAELYQDLEPIIDQIEPLESEQLETTVPIEATLDAVATIKPEQPPPEPMIADAQLIEPIPFEPIDLLEQSADLEQIFEQIEPLESELMEQIEPMLGVLPEILPEPVEADATEAGYY